jgi:hypothetical protein
MLKKQKKKKKKKDFTLAGRWPPRRQEKFNRVEALLSL